MERLSKILSMRGICSRREADSYIERGLVLVDGVRVDQLGTKVDPGARIELDPEATSTQEKRVTIIMNKPVGYVSNLPEKDYKPAAELITSENCVGPFTKFSWTKLAVAGRLDIDSRGLLIFTQDGRVAKAIIGADTAVEKEYFVRFEGEVTKGMLEKLRFGLSLDGKKLKHADVQQLHENQLRFILREGRKRQIRRMCDQVGLKVYALKRVRVGHIRLGNLKPGQWRTLSDKEVSSLLNPARVRAT